MSEGGSVVSTTSIVSPLEARPYVEPHVRRTPLLTSRALSEVTGFDIRLKAEMLQRTGAYKIRGALHRIARLSPEEKARGVVCSSAGNHAQGVALAASISGIQATVVMASNATESKVQATRAYGADVVLRGDIWDDADEHARELVEQRGLTYVHPFDDHLLIAGQGTLGIEIHEDLPEVHTVIVPIGGGGLISGVAIALAERKPSVRVIGVESTGGPGMHASLRAGHVVTLDTVETPIDGLRVKRVGSNTFDIVRKHVDEVVTVPDAAIFDAVIWLMTRCKLVAEGAAAAPVAALLAGLIEAPPESVVVPVLSGGNLDVSQLRGLKWN
jgi:threonine dehydratase